MYTGVVANFMGFTAVGVIIIAMVGVGVAEESGLVKVLIRKLVIVAPRWALCWILTFVGILSSVAADAGYLVLIPLAAAAFVSVGRHPLAGLAVGFASVAAAFLVNISAWWTRRGPSTWRRTCGSRSARPCCSRC